MEMLFEEEQRKIQAISDRLQRDSNSIAVLVINKDGRKSPVPVKQKISTLRRFSLFVET